MNETQVYLPAPSSDDFVELARSAKGKLYKKQILKFGNFAHPNDPKSKLRVTREVGESLVRNFHNGVCDIVQVPVVDEANRHTEDPFRNIGEVVDLTVDDKGVWATVDARKKEYADELGKTLIGASAMMHMNYTDTKTGKKVGPTLLHVAITNRPYITNLQDFEEIIAASADNSHGNVTVLTEEEDMQISKEDAIAALSAHGIDVEALLETAESNGPSGDDIVVAMSRVLADAGVLTAQDDDEISLTDVAEAVIEVANEKVELSAKVEKLEQDAETLRLANAEVEVDQLVSDGKILPSKRDSYLKLSLTNREMFEELVPETAIVSLSEDGVTTFDERESETHQRTTEETERLVKLAREMTGRK